MMVVAMNENALALLRTRRSVSAKSLGQPGPSAEALEQILRIAARVPDHKRLAPWRFVVFEGEARAAFGGVLADALVAEDKDAPSPIRLETERARFLRAPVVIAVVSSPRSTSVVPEWEQVLSAGAACLNLCLAAHAMGFAANWITEWYAYSPAVGKALGLGDGERVAGFIYIGTPLVTPDERERPDLAAIVSNWTA